MPEDRVCVNTLAGASKMEAHAQLQRPARRTLEASSRPPLAFVLARGRLDWSPDESPAYPRGSGQLVAVCYALRRDYSEYT